MWSRWSNSRTWCVAAIGMFLQDEWIKLLTDKSSPTLKLPRLNWNKDLPDQSYPWSNSPRSKLPKTKVFQDQSSARSQLFWIKIHSDSILPHQRFSGSKLSVLNVLCDQCSVKAMLSHITVFPDQTSMNSKFSQIKVLWSQSSLRSKFSPLQGSGWRFLTSNHSQTDTSNSYKSRTCPTWDLWWKHVCICYNYRALLMSAEPALLDGKILNHRFAQMLVHSWSFSIMVMPVSII